MMLSVALISLVAAVSMAGVLPDTKEVKLAKASNDLAFDLLKASGKSKNVVMSPFSISTALAMVYLGADGTTARVMRRVLHYGEYDLPDHDIHPTFKSILTRVKQNTKDYVLSAYNGLLIQEDFPVLQSYQEALTENYFVTAQNVDFATQGAEVRDNINSVVERETRGKIKNFLEDPPNADTQLFLLNAVYFLGSWEHPFNPLSTYETTFYNNGNQEKTVQMMSRDGTYRYSKNNDLDSAVVVIPYRGETSASMVIVLPNKRNGVAELQRIITRESLDGVVENAHRGRLDLSVPKFSLEHKTDLAEDLKGLGLEELFGKRANLSRIAGDSNRLVVSKAVHKAVIDVDEKGTEAAGATGIEIVATSLPPSIRVTHPFLFFIREDQSGLILFSGRVDEL